MVLPLDSSAPKVATPLAALAGLALLGSGLYGTGFWLTHDSGPSNHEIEVAAQQLRQAHKPGDLVILQPAYATQAREFLGDLDPVAVWDPLAEDLSVHPRVWVFGLFGKAEQLRARFEASGLKRVESLTDIPGITMDLWAVNSTQSVAYDFVAQLKNAKVWHEKGTERIACETWRTKNGQGGKMGRWACPNDTEWFYVAPEWHRMGEHLRLCLWAHPPNDGRIMIQFPQVPLTGRLYGHAGHTLNASLNAHAPIDFDVKIGAGPGQRFVIELSDTWRPFALRTATATVADVTFGVSASNAGVNHFCFSAGMRTGVSP